MVHERLSKVMTTNSGINRICKNNGRLRLRCQFATEGLDAALEEKPRSGRPKHFTGRDAAAITVLACTDPPEGYAKWSMRLIADKAVELEYVSTISYQTVHNILKKTNFLPT